MSILSKIWSAISGSNKTESVTYPCRNCESDCGVYPKACGECKPYKEKLIDALYNVEHLEEFYDRYEIASEAAAPAGMTECPHCGAPVNGAVCEYCGSRLAQANGKIQVESANDIPNPIIDARDIIYARRALIDKYSESSGSSSSGFIDSVIDAIAGNVSENSLGNPMTESEIKTMAEKYGVSVKDYLEGLDMGTYLSKSGYEDKEKEENISNIGSTVGAAGIGTLAGMLLGNKRQQSYGNNRDDGRPKPPPMNGNGDFDFRRDGGRSSGHGSGGGPGSGFGGGRHGGGGPGGGFGGGHRSGNSRGGRNR